MKSVHFLAVFGLRGVHVIILYVLQEPDPTKFFFYYNKQYNYLSPLYGRYPELTMYWLLAAF